MVAFVSGALLGSRSLRPLTSKVFLPVYGAALAFVVYFGAFASVRGQSNAGLERLNDVRQYQAQIMSSPDAPRSQTMISRLTSFNQLSQIGRIVDEDGFLEGSTLEYLAYAFVPRFLWPDKPTIAKGAWFAMRIGQANISRDGRIMNSVNMTIPGELYLNFSWLGVVAGCLVFGALLAALWTRTRFWSSPSNTIGTAFGFYLLWVGLTMGADLQLIVTMLAFYLLFVAVSVGFRLVGWTSSGELRRRSRPARVRAAADSDPPASEVSA